MYSITTQSLSGNHYSILDNKISKIKFSTLSDNKTGSGYGYLKFTVTNPYSFNIDGIGLDYKIWLKKNTQKLLFFGKIRAIKEGEQQCFGSFLPGLRFLIKKYRDL